MPAWPGGNCPGCGETVPASLIHCPTCRALLNDDLDPDSVHIPPFVPLPEIVAMVDVEIAAYQIVCPKCSERLRVHRKYLGEKVSCKHCRAQFELDLANPKLQCIAFFAACPHCGNELRAHMKYAGATVACKHCNGQLHVLGQLV